METLFKSLDAARAILEAVERVLHPLIRVVRLLASLGIAIQLLWLIIQP